LTRDARTGIELSVTTQSQTYERADRDAAPAALPGSPAARIIGIALFAVMAGAALLVLAAAVGLAVVFASDLLSRWTGLAASHLLAAMVSAAALALITVLAFVLSTGVRDAIDNLAVVCDELSEERLVRRLAQALDDAGVELAREPVIGAKKPRRRRR
jgi:hypothetical protein